MDLTELSEKDYEAMMESGKYYEEMGHRDNLVEDCDEQMARHRKMLGGLFDKDPAMALPVEVGMRSGKTIQGVEDALWGIADKYYIKTMTSEDLDRLAGTMGISRQPGVMARQESDEYAARLKAELKGRWTTEPEWDNVCRLPTGGKLEDFRYNWVEVEPDEYGGSKVRVIGLKEPEEDEPTEAEKRIHSNKGRWTTETDEEALDKTNPHEKVYAKRLKDRWAQENARSKPYEGKIEKETDPHLSDDANEKLKDFKFPYMKRERLGDTGVGKEWLRECRYVETSLVDKGGEPLKKPEEDEHEGMVQGYDGEWRWL